MLGIYCKRQYFAGCIIEPWSRVLRVACVLTVHIRWLAHRCASCLPHNGERVIVSAIETDGQGECRGGGVALHCSASQLFVYNKASEFFTTQRSQQRLSVSATAVHAVEVTSYQFNWKTLRRGGRGWADKRQLHFAKHPSTYLFMQTHNSLFRYFVRAPGNQ